MRNLSGSVLTATVFLSHGVVAAPGALDASFGSGGIVHTALGGARPSAVALDANGDIVAAATTGRGPTAATFVRYLPSGALDTSFGSGGIVSQTFHGENNSTGGIALQSDGKIVVEQVTTSVATGAVLEFLLARYNSNGTSDTTFGAAGHVVLSYPAAAPYTATPTAFLSDPDGDIVVLFSLTPPLRNHSPDLTALARYDKNGVLDPTFGTAGRSAAVPIGGIPEGIALLTNGHTRVTTGNALVSVAPTSTAEFGPTGVLLSGSSAASVAATSSLSFASPLFLTNGDLLALTTVPGGPNRRDVDSAVLRLLPNGSEDPTFQSPAFEFGPRGAPIPSVAEGLAVAPNGRIVAAGEAVTAQAASIGFGLVRLDETGAIDATFGTNGVVTTELPSGGQALFVVMQPDEKIVAIGQAFSGQEPGLAVVRYLGN